MNPTQIKRLASRYGIAPSFEDARGNTVDTDPEVARKLLISMGVLDQAGTRLQPEQQAILPPAIVVRADRAGRIAVDLGCAISAKQIEWQLTLEDGSSRSGTAAVAAANADATAHLTLPQLPHGYHRLVLGHADAATMLIVTPGRAAIRPVAPAVSAAL